MAEATGGAEVRVAVDIGGTFTDLQILVGETGEMHEFKTPSTPHDPSIGLLDGLRAAAARFGFPLDAVRQVLHGTTIATNAVLERKLPPGAVLTTAGFEDVLEIGRHGRRDVYAISIAQPAPLVPRRLRLGLRERMRADGSVATPLDEAGVHTAALRLREAGVRAVAVCLLHAYANPAHERRVGKILAQALPGVAVTLSSDISPEMREYERLSTTLLNAMLVPIVAAYTDRLAQRLADERLSTRVYLVQSNGGVSGLARAGREPARLLLSGPSGGAAAARRLASVMGMPNLVGVDMGGTSFDVSLVVAGRIAMVNEGEVDGLPVRLPMVEMRTIGAGGGSIAWVDEGGRLRIGPHSAGAMPGPACYGRGGRLPTVTDANLLLGRLDPARFLGGAMPLDLGAAHAAIAELAERLGLGVEEAASAIVAVTGSNLATAIRLSLFEKGLDPEDFALLSFGGAGGVHACEVAEELGVPRVVFPPHASTLSAWGILGSDIVHDLTAPLSGTLAASGPAMAAAAARLSEEAAQLLAEDGIAEAGHEATWSLDCRYAGQAFELTVPLPAGPGDLARAAADFHALHRQRFSYDEPETAVEVVALRLAARGKLAGATQATRAPPPGGGRPRGRRAIRLDGGSVQAEIWDRAALAPAVPVVGPALVEEPYTTSFIPPGWTATLHASGAIIAVRARAGTVE